MPNFVLRVYFLLFSHSNFFVVLFCCAEDFLRSSLPLICGVARGKKVSLRTDKAVKADDSRRHYAARKAGLTLSHLEVTLWLSPGKLDGGLRNEKVSLVPFAVLRCRCSNRQRGLRAMLKRESTVNISRLPARRAQFEKQ